jgi:hypothetical protein
MWVIYLDDFNWRNGCAVLVTTGRQDLSDSLYTKAQTHRPFLSIRSEARGLRAGV